MLGIRATPVNPPAMAAAIPLSKLSLYSSPGSLKFTCISNHPGETCKLVAFTTVFVLLILKEQSFAVLSLAVLGLGVALTGFFPTEYGLYFTTVLMSIGFHYFESVKQSLSLQWFSIEEAPQMLGRLLAIGSITSLTVYALLWCSVNLFEVDYLWNFLVAGVLCCCLAAFMWLAFPIFSETVPQNKGLEGRYSWYSPRL